MKKKAISALLSLVLIVSLLPVTAMAASTEETMTQIVGAQWGFSGTSVSITEGEGTVLSQSETTFTALAVGTAVVQVDDKTWTISVSADWTVAGKENYHWAVVTHDTDTVNYPKLIISYDAYTAGADAHVVRSGGIAYDSGFSLSSYVPWASALTGSTETGNIGVRSVAILAGANNEKVRPTSTRNWFNCTNAKGTNQSAKVLKRIDTSGLDTSRTTSMPLMFQQCEALEQLDVSAWDTSKVTNMKNMFSDCNSLESIDVSHWNTSEVTTIYAMFGNCWALKTLDVSAWDTSKITNMAYAFTICKALTGLNLSKWNTGNVTTMKAAFQCCESMTALDLSSFNTSKVTDMSYMFFGDKALKTLNLSSFDTSKVTDMTSIFYECQALETLDLSHFDTSKVTDMSYMFYGDKALKTLNVSHWDTSEATNMYCMFYECQALTALDVSSFDTSKVTNMAYMFYYDKALEMLNVSSFYTPKATNMYCIFCGCQALKTLDLSHFDTSKITNMSYMFYDCQALTALDLSSFDTSKVTDMSYMFYSCQALTALDVSSFDTSKVTNMCGMFGICKKLSSLDVKNFNTANVTDMAGMFHAMGLNTSAPVTITGLASFNTSNVTSMYSMFGNGENYTGSGKLTDETLAGISNWDVSKVQNFTCMFYGQGVYLTELDVSRWDTSSAISFSHLFCDCMKLKSLDLSNWDVGNVTTMINMFDDCFALTNFGDLSRWNTSSLLDLYGFLNGCTSFVGDDGVLDLSGWDTSKCVSFYEMFRGIKVHTICLSGWSTASLGNAWTATSPFAEDIYYEHSSGGSLGTGVMFLDCSDLVNIYVDPDANFQCVNSTDMFKGCTNLLGKEGTTFDSEKTDKEYAKLDGGSDDKGYFTIGLTGTLTVTGNTETGSVLTAVYTPGNNTGALSYEWKRDGKTISGATQSTYQLTLADGGCSITALVHSDAQGGSVVSNPIAVANSTLETGVSYGVTLILGEKIDVKLTMKNLPSGIDLNKLKVYVGRLSPVEVQLRKDSAGQPYAILFSAQPTQLCETIHCSVQYDGVEKKAFDYSVQKFCAAKITSASASAVLKNLCTALLNYGAKAQKYFTPETANSELATYYNTKAHDKDFSATVIPAKVPSGTASNALISGIDAQLILNEMTTLKFTIHTQEELTDSDIVIRNNYGELAAFTLSRDGEDYTVELKDIGANRLHRTYTMSVKGLNVTYGPYSYCYDVVQHTTDSVFTEDLKTLCKALYEYGEAAKAYEGK